MDISGATTYHVIKSEKLRRNFLKSGAFVTTLVANFIVKVKIKRFLLKNKWKGNCNISSVNMNYQH